MNKDYYNYSENAEIQNENAEAEQQLDAHVKERAMHPKMQELSKGIDNCKSYYIVTHRAFYSERQIINYELNAVKAMALIAYECNHYDVKNFAVLKVTLEKDSYHPYIKHLTVQELQDEAFMESNHAIAKITAP